MAMSFVPLGVGDAFTALYYSSCLVVEAEGARLLVDCPHPIRKMMREAAEPLDVDAIDAVVLTHLHGDHVSGLEGLAFFSFFALGRRVPLLAHPDVAARLWSGHLAVAMEHLEIRGQVGGRALGFEDYFELHPLDETRPVTFGPFAVECRKTIHHIPTTALRLRAGGRCLGYSADTDFDPELIEWLAAADLVVHETNLGIHTPYERLAALPAALRARMRLIHYPDAFDRAGSVIEPLDQGRRYSLDNAPPRA